MGYQIEYVVATYAFPAGWLILGVIALLILNRIANEVSACADSLEIMNDLERESSEWMDDDVEADGPAL